MFARCPRDVREQIHLLIEQFCLRIQPQIQIRHEPIYGADNIFNPLADAFQLAADTIRIDRWPTHNHRGAAAA